jgi:hypothetical protein
MKHRQLFSSYLIPKDIYEVLENLLRESIREHFHCDACWFCCAKCTHPDHPQDECSPYPQGSGHCTCGADEWNHRARRALEDYLK